MTLLGNGLYNAKHFDDALSAWEGELALCRRIGRSQEIILATQSNLAITYNRLGRPEQALNAFRALYFGYLRLNGEGHEDTLLAANNYAAALNTQNRFEETKSILGPLFPVARRVLGETARLKGGNDLLLKMRKSYADALYRDTGATLHDIREAVTTLEDTARTARRVLGAAHPLTKGIEDELQNARATLSARESS